MKKKSIFSLILATILMVSMLSVPSQVLAYDDDKQIFVRIVQYHPGVPNYDVTYDFRVYYGDEYESELLDESQYKLYTDVPEIIVDGSSITVPASFKDNTDIEVVKVYATFNDYTDKVGYYLLGIKNWKLTFEDEFEGTSLDETKWSNNYECEEYGNGLNLARPLDGNSNKTYAAHESSYEVKDGNLVMKIVKSNGQKTWNQGEEIDVDYFSTFLVTKGKFEQKFGCFQTRIKLPTNPDAGSNSAVWLLPTSAMWGNAFFATAKTGDLQNNLCGEFDLIEYSPAWGNEFGNTVHWWDAQKLEHMDSSANKTYKFPN